MGTKKWQIEVDFIGLAMVFFIIGGAIAIVINTYQGEKTKQLEIELKIEQEKNKTNEANWKYKDY